MRKNFSLIFPWIFLIIAIPILNFIVVHKSFSLGLYGDDWLQLYNLWLEFYIKKTSSFFDIRSYLGAYLPQYIFLGIIHSLAGYEPKAYFLASYLLKVFSSIGVYFFIKQVSKNIWCAVVATVLFTFSAAGLETTDWVFNMNTFAGLGFFGIASFFYLQARNNKKFFSKEYVSFIILLALSLFVVPVRMHGAVPFLILSDLFLTFFIEKNKFSKLLFFRILTSVLILFIFVKLGSYGTPEYSKGRVIDAFKLVEPAIAQGKYDFMLYFFGTIGNVIIPDKVDVSFIENLSTSNFLLRRTQFGPALLTSFILFLFNYIILRTINPKLRVFVISAITGLLLTLAGIFIKSVNPSISFRAIFSILTGLNLFLLGGCIFLMRRFLNSYFVSSIVISLIWIVCFSGVYWLYSPHLVLETTSRYLTFAAVGVSLFLSALIIESFNNARTNFWRIIPIGLLVFILSIHFFSGQVYFSNLVKTRNQDLIQKSWDSLLKDVPLIDESVPNVFYFTTDNPQSLYGVFTFGFWPKAGMVYKITDAEKTPLGTDSYSELLEYAKTGEPLKKVHGRKQQAVKLENIYSFDLRNGQVINKTSEIREKLRQDLGI